MGLLHIFVMFVFGNIISENLSLELVQDDRYSKYIGRMAIVPMTYGRHVPIISDKVIAIATSPCPLLFNFTCISWERKEENTRERIA